MFPSMLEERAFRKIMTNHTLPYMREGTRVLEIQCADGASTVELARKEKSSHICGVDRDADYIAVAKKEGKRQKNAMFHHVQLERLRETLPAATSYPDYCSPYDIIVSNGALSGLATWEIQQHVLLEMRELVRPGSLLILIESFDLPVDLLNRLRMAFMMPPIKTPVGEVPIPFIPFSEWAKDNFVIHKCDNIGNMYSILTRVIGPQMDSIAAIKLKQMAVTLPALPVYRYSPYFMWVLGVR